MEKVGDFIKNAKGLSNNPLGIIALFISLIYGLAVALLTFSAKHLTTYEKLPLIYFIILFPILILAVFSDLVRNHHWKLYSPKDFKDDKSFLTPLNIIEKLNKVSNEFKIDEILITKQPPIINDNKDNKSKSQIKGKILNNSKDINLILNESAEPIFKMNSINNINFMEYFNIEEAVISKLQSRFKTDAIRDMKIINTDYSFDALFDRNKGPLIATDIKITQNINSLNNLIEQVIVKFTSSKTAFTNRDFKYFVVVVSKDKELLSKLRELLGNKVNNDKNLKGRIKIITFEQDELLD